MHLVSAPTELILTSINSFTVEANWKIPKLKETKFLNAYFHNIIHIAVHTPDPAEVQVSTVLPSVCTNAKHTLPCQGKLTVDNIMSTHKKKYDTVEACCHIHDDQGRHY